MRIPKFKVGDKVRVLRKSTDDEHDLWMDSWVYNMDRFIGKICTIDYCNLSWCRSSDKIYPKYRLVECCLNFPEFVLENEIQLVNNYYSILLGSRYMAKKVIFQNHHLIYENKEKRVKPVTRKIRKGVHMAITLLRRFTFLTGQEINTIKLEAELKRVYNEEK